jgi:membrane protease YdiL (CAAX protease family)
MTYAVMVAEFAAGSLIWWRRVRYPVLLAAMGLHFGINLTMQFPVFQYVMMASLLTFVYPEDLDRWMLRLKSTKLGMRFQSRQA